MSSCQIKKTVLVLNQLFSSPLLTIFMWKLWKDSRAFLKSEDASLALSPVVGICLGGEDLAHHLIALFMSGHPSPSPAKAILYCCNASDGSSPTILSTGTLSIVLKEHILEKRNPLSLLLSKRFFSDRR